MLNYIEALERLNEQLTFTVKKCVEVMTQLKDWVVEPNALGTGTFALGDLMMTKPYVSGAAYINRMSDFCRSCAFDPKTNCPITPFYWAFLVSRRDKLQDNPRLCMPMASLDKWNASQKHRDQQIFRTVKDILIKGEVVSPKSLDPEPK
ncbi:MAG: hypothetical protein JRL30_27595 [Deltaproteobacteria bacterium]|nr:hypothetical protein [Deltaproteobacteria bacterium]